MEIEGSSYDTCLKQLNKGITKLGTYSDDNWLDESALSDITQFIDENCSNLKPEAIVKHPGFNLFEGTHSLEINNAKLDSYLIELKEEEINFDCDRAYGSEVSSSSSSSVATELDYVLYVVDRLVNYVVSWLNDYQPLPTTVLSCCYVSHVLVDIYENRYNRNSAPVQYLHTGSVLYDKILNSAVLGLCYFAGFIKKLVKSGTIFEEEDLNFNDMGLEGLDYLPPQETVLGELSSSIKIVRSLSLDKQQLDHLLHLLELIESLVILEDHLTKYSTDTTHLNRLIELAETLDRSPSNVGVALPGAFSMRIQRDRCNHFPPKCLVNPRRNYQGYVTMARDILVILRVADSRDIMELFQFANFFNKLHQRHVVARSLFSLFLIREGTNVLGKYTPYEFVMAHLNCYTLQGTKLSEMMGERNIKGLLDPILHESGNVLFEWYQNAAQNTARYRQGYNRQLILWDSIQAQLETIEGELVTFGIEDKVDELPKFSTEVDQHLMPLASWSFTMKVLIMIEFVLKGFSLEIYKPYESFSMYWFSFYLSQQVESCIQKIQVFIESKIKAIHSMNKKIKKLKPGDKRDKLKQQYRQAMDTQMVQLQTNKQFNNYHLQHCAIIKSLSLFQVFQFGILKSYGVINDSPPSGKFVDGKLIHNLRFKPFSSVGVPELPSYELFKQVLSEFVPTEPSLPTKVARVMNFMKQQLDESDITLDNIIQSIKGNDSNGVTNTATRLVKEEALEYYTQLKTSIKALRTNSLVVFEKLKSRQRAGLGEKYRVNFSYMEGTSDFFPLLNLVERTSSKR